MGNVIFRIYPGSCQYPIVGQLLTLQRKAKITLKIHLGSSIRLSPFQDMSQETWGCFEHAVNVQLPILSVFWGDAGNLALPVGQERNRNSYVHMHPIGSTLTSQMNPRHRKNGKNTKGYKHTEPTLCLSPSLSLSKAVTVLNCLTSLKLFFCCKIEIVWILGCTLQSCLQLC